VLNPIFICCGGGLLNLPFIEIKPIDYQNIRNAVLYKKGGQALGEESKTAVNVNFYF
jgi:hypothetical protein